MITTYDDNDYEPSFRIRFQPDTSIENIDGYWEEYDTLNKSWYRLCHECIEKVDKSSVHLCTYHSNKRKNQKGKLKLKSTDMKKKSKRLNRKEIKKEKKKNNKNIPLQTIVQSEVEQIVNDEYEELNGSLGIVISISSSLNKKQICRVKDFITKFHTDSQPIQFTCESQPDYIDDTTTHVIANDFGSFTTTLTKQIIQACVRHIFISSINWIVSSLEQSSIQDHFPFEILRDKKSLKNSRGIKQCRFDQLPVFPSSCIISVECHMGLRPMNLTRDELLEIIELSGATPINDYIQYDTLIILCNTKKEIMNVKKQNEDNFMTIKEENIYYCKPEFLFDSIVRHEVQSIEKYQW